jgi:hypothetical protein
MLTRLCVRAIALTHELPFSLGYNSELDADVGDEKTFEVG